MLLQQLEVDCLVITGVATDACVLNTALDAQMRKFPLGCLPMSMRRPRLPGIAMHSNCSMTLRMPISAPRNGSLPASLGDSGCTSMRSTGPCFRALASCAGCSIALPACGQHVTGQTSATDIRLCPVRPRRVSAGRGHQEPDRVMRQAGCRRVRRRENGLQSGRCRDRPGHHLHGSIR